VGWDAVTLFLVVPALALMLPGLWHGSLRAKLVVTGILAYFLYQYVEYAAFLAYGPLFLLYVATFALSLTGIILLVATINLAEAGARFGPRFPRRAMVGLSLFMALLLTGMWLPLVARTAGGDIGNALDGATTLVVQALDLGFLVPLAFFTAVTVWRRMPVGYLLSSVVVVKAVAMATAIAAMLLFEASATGELAMVPLAIFALTALVGGAIALRVYGSIGAEPAERRAVADAPQAQARPAR
jgi:hypothetical protein